MQRAQQGETKAFEELVVLSDRHVLHLAYALTGSLIDAQDVYQETFLRAFKAIGGFRFQSSFRTWILRITMNQAINWRKKKKLRLFFSLDTQHAGKNDSMFFQIADKTDITASVQSGDIMQQIHLALQRLSSKERAVFSLRHFQEVKIKEIALILGCAEGTVKNVLFRATQKMQKALAEYYRGMT